MKFGQSFQTALQRGEYPQEWIDSAISYKKLKKCIKRVQQELLSLGLDQETLNSLWQHVGNGASVAGDANSDVDDPDRRLHYSMNGSKKLSFTPRLTIAIDPRDGSPMDAWLSPETRRALRKLARSASVSETQPNGDKTVDLKQGSILPERDPTSTDHSEDVSAEDTTEQLETIEIPLTSDNEFFQILRRELADLERLQKNEQSHLQSEIVKLADDLRAIKASKGKRSKEEIEAWRKIFALYNDAQVFLSSNEQDAGVRDASHAQQHLQSFTKALNSPQNQQALRILGKEANTALDRFLHININLLRLMKFQEINRTALTKIIKKFDKRTALHARSTLPTTLLTGPNGASEMSKDLAKATCFTISQELLHIIPQLDDYLCPVCFSISWKPVRLSCGHVFCIRCLVVMQRQEQDHCPLCRGNVVLEATSDHLDKELMKFLKTNFKQEVKEKQKQNEIAAGIDRWGAQYEKSQKCVVM